MEDAKPNTNLHGSTHSRLKLLHCLVVAAGVLPASTALAQEVAEASLQGKNDAELNNFGIVLLLLVLMIVGVVLVTRVCVKRKVNRLMMVNSAEQKSDALDELQAGEVPATRMPEFVTVEATSARNDGVATREALVAQDRALLARGVGLDLLAAFGYYLVSQIEPSLSQSSYWYYAAPMLLATMFGFLTVVRYFVWGWESQAEKSVLADMVRGLAVWPPIRLAKPEWRPHVTAIAIIVAVWSAIICIDSVHSRVGFGLLLAAAFHAVLFTGLMASSRGTPNLKLVVLRVFGVDETAIFTFKGLLEYWKHFGTFFTVVDPSFLKSEQQQRSLLVVAILIPFFLILPLGEFDVYWKDPILFLWAGVMPAALLIGTGYVFLSLRQVERGFVRSRNDLVERLRRLDAWPRALDLTFRSMPMMCHNNVWKIAVSECVMNSDAVLMDLRGFSQDRMGCRYEVDYLLDVIPIDRVLFLVEPEGVSQTQKLILELWEYLRTNSPNLKLQRPQARIYVTSEKSNDKDIQGALDELLHVASRTVQSREAVVAPSH